MTGDGWTWHKMAGNWDEDDDDHDNDDDQTGWPNNSFDFFLFF